LGIRQKHCRADENAVYLDDLGFLHGPYYYDRISSLLGPPSQAGSFTKKSKNPRKNAGIRNTASQ
jgi:hypothetical protein